MLFPNSAYNKLSLLQLHGLIADLPLKSCVIYDSLITLHGPFHIILYGPLNFSHDSSVAMASLHKDTHISQLTYLLSALDLNHTTQLFLPVLTKICIS